MSINNADESTGLLGEHVVSSYSDLSPIVREDDEGITIRRPVHYHSDVTTGQQPERHGHIRATINRLNYYSRLDPRRNSTLIMPNHVVPSEYFLVIPFRQDGGKQSSLVTIFSIWNTMVGTSILSMPWALEQAGFACGISLMCLMAAITLYTAYRVMKSPELAGVHCHGDSGVEFSDIAKIYLGKWGEYTSVIFSLITLLGAAIVYWVLMSNFLYHSVTFIYNQVTDGHNASKPHPLSNISHHDVCCPNPRKSSLEYFVDHSNHQDPTLAVIELSLLGNQSASASLFHRIWVQNETVPFFLVLILGPIINLKSPTFFTKFNSLGTISVLYIMVLVAYKASQWRIHINFQNSKSPFYVPEFKWTFPALTGVLSLAMFIHNCVLSIVKNQRYPENNGRDLSIAYLCVSVTYIFVGIVFYISFPLPKSCIEDNLLNNFYNSDILAFTGRLFLFFQMVTVFPLILYICRVQVFSAVFNVIYPGLFWVLLLNTVVISLSIVFAVFLPQIGTIIRYSGALCGFIYIFTLPSLVYLMSLYSNRSVQWPVVLIHVFVMVLGLANFISQFFI
ncbi:hypothetical protein LSH36_196g03032 [Paralvinella palmiformis]|uniref:Amino acid transporter transmembrane domain-containing protein n=1 Tax=Paralvinella palmiformis TaxID=53620 RepID=A0AAD9N4V8_9ANNE|nr:hypothetical protein LSH36_196g03032 [Paralvinella palmiformis]